MTSVLVVDDDRALLRVLRLGLAAKGHEVSTATSGEEALSKAATESPDVIILDLGLPDLDGIDVCRRIRQWSDVPILVLSATAGEERKVSALDSGADDYVTKPFGMAELEARIRTALRHRRVPEPEEHPIVAVGQLEFDLVHHQAKLAGRMLELTAREFDILSFLARHAGKICTPQMIIEQVWGGQYGGEAQTLRVYIYRLRRKLGDEAGELLRSAPGLGYTLAVV
jgi:two-component system KDP operon response regulator KdpE